MISGVTPATGPSACEAVRGSWIVSEALIRGGASGLVDVRGSWIELEALNVGGASGFVNVRPGLNVDERVFDGGHDSTGGDESR